jgi:hypothetical protein
MAVTSRRAPDGPQRGPNIVVAGFGFVALGIFAALYLLRRDIYFTVIDLWSFRPFDYPFIDLLYIPSGIACWHMGIDVYLQNPCDPLGRLYDYSPLWLRLSFLGSIKPSINVFGISLDALFMLSLAALPRPRRRIDYLPVLLCVVSPMTVFALERGNIDTLMFIFAMATIVCIDRAPVVRSLGYGAIMLASLLKFYPFVLFILLLRERFRVFLSGAIASICVIAGFIWYYHDEMRRMIAAIPRPSYFTDAFGAAQLPGGMGVMLRYLLQQGGIDGATINGLPENPALYVLTFLILLAVAGLIVLHLIRRDDFRLALQDLIPRESLCMVAGASLVCGCFFLGRSIGYREIMILLVLPGLIAAARTSSTVALSRLFHATTWMAVFLMAYLVPQRLLYHQLGSIPKSGGSLPTFAFWFGRELCWWWFVAVLMAILIRFVLDSPVWLAVSEPSLHRRRPAL